MDILEYLIPDEDEVEDPDIYADEVNSNIASQANRDNEAREYSKRYYARHKTEINNQKRIHRRREKARFQPSQSAPPSGTAK